jgi:hypothetical protein
MDKLAYQREYYYKNKEKRLAYQNDYREKHREQICEYLRNHYVNFQREERGHTRRISKPKEPKAVKEPKKLEEYIGTLQNKIQDVITIKEGPFTMNWT